MPQKVNSNLVSSPRGFWRVGWSYSSFSIQSEYSKSCRQGDLNSKEDMSSTEQVI